MKSLPQSASEVDFTLVGERFIKYDYFAITLTIEKINAELAYTAARAGLVYADFEVIEIDQLNEVIFAEYPNFLISHRAKAGIYFKDVPEGMAVAIIVRSQSINKVILARKIMEGLQLFAEAELQE